LSDFCTQYKIEIENQKLDYDYRTIYTEYMVAGNNEYALGDRAASIVKSGNGPTRSGLCLRLVRQALEAYYQLNSGEFYAMLTAFNPALHSSANYNAYQVELAFAAYANSPLAATAGVRSISPLELSRSPKINAIVFARVSMPWGHTGVPARLSSGWAIVENTWAKRRQQLYGIPPGAPNAISPLEKWDKPSLILSLPDDKKWIEELLRGKNE